MCCTFVPPYLLQRVALWGGTRQASASGRETLQVDDRLRARRESPAARWPLHACRDQEAGGAHCQQHGVAAWGGCPEQWRPPGRRSRRLTRHSTHPVKFGTCSTASSAGNPLTDVAARSPSPSTTGVITTTHSGTELNWSLAMEMGRSLTASPSRWM